MGAGDLGKEGKTQLERKSFYSQSRHSFHEGLGVTGECLIYGRVVTVPIPLITKEDLYSKSALSSSFSLLLMTLRLCAFYTELFEQIIYLSIHFYDVSLHLTASPLGIPREVPFLEV